MELSLGDFSDQEISLRTDQLVRSERKITHLVLKYINEIAARKIYLKLGYDSLHRYLVVHQKYSDDQAYARSDAAAVLRTCPLSSEQIETGKITLTQLKKVGQCLRLKRKLGQEISAESLQNIIHQIEDKSVYETEKVLSAELNFTPKVHPRIRPQADGSVRVELTFSPQQFEILKHAQELISHAVPNNDLAEAITHFAQLVIKKAEGKSSGKTTQSFSETPPMGSRSEKPRGRKYLSVKVRRSVLRRAGNCCEHVQPESRVKCNSRFQLQVDHVIPLAKEGGDEIENLRLLCGVHNRREALRWGLSRPLGPRA